MARKRNEELTTDQLLRKCARLERDLEALKNRVADLQKSNDYLSQQRRYEREWRVALGRFVKTAVTEELDNNWQYS